MKEVFGSILFLAVAGGLIWGWNYWQDSGADHEESRPSIGVLSDASVVASQAVDTADSVSDTKTGDTKKTDVSSETSKDRLEVKVLNGGAAKGSAAKVQDMLKKDGYTKATAASATGDYVGTTVYYSGSHETDAIAVQKFLSKEYPKAEVKIASSSSEEGSASVVVMLGK